MVGQQCACVRHLLIVLRWVRRPLAERQCPLAERQRPLAELQRPLAERLVVVALDEAQLGPQTLAVAQQAAVLLQQPAVLLEAPGCRLLLALLLLQLAGQVLSEESHQPGQNRTLSRVFGQ